MRGVTASLLIAVLGVVSPSVAEASTPTANVVSNATLVMYVVSGAFTNFEFHVSDCPEGEPITITWEAEQPDRADISAGEGFYFSGPDATQRFVLTTVGAFSPGYRWVGSGTVTRGPVVIPVTGSGSTKIVS
ncbi:MAG: hypothetical protein H0V79_08780 [Actinobacteria bacterium]|nr:hypothetical protein [Actinomycetota bacterium]